tara:strand:+ start:327 stop:623 length:297 start_codon:yes stop_codon:yes gene_type:complete
MALTKTIIDDKIEVVGEFKTLQIRQATIIKEDEKELSRSFHRRMLNCGTLDASDNLIDTNITSETEEVKGIATAVWTQSVKDAWKANLIKEKNPFNHA